jgi:hypothetical protein
MPRFDRFTQKNPDVAVRAVDQIEEALTSCPAAGRRSDGLDGSPSVLTPCQVHSCKPI